MDEEQTGLTSPIAGGLRGIRRSVSSNVFRPRMFNQQPDQKTTTLLTENSLSLQRISNQLENIGGQVSSLSLSLSAVKDNLAISDQIEKNREREKQRRDAILAEQGLREGKEGQIEKKIQNALLAPVRTIAKKTQDILSRVGTFLLTIAAGWLTDKVLRFFTLKTQGNAEAMRKFKIEFLSNLLFFGGTLALFKGGLGKILLGLKNIGAIVLKIGVSGILTRGFKSALSFVRNTLSLFRNFVLGGGKFIAQKIGFFKKASNLLGNLAVGLGLGDFATRLKPLKRVRSFGRLLGQNISNIPVVGPLLRRIPIINTLLFGAEFFDRKNKEQTNLQAGVGAGTNLLGFLAAFKLGAIATKSIISFAKAGGLLGTFLFPGGGTVTGAVIGGLIGLVASFILPGMFSNIADKITGVNKDKKENKQNENDNMGDSSNVSSNNGDVSNVNPVNFSSDRANSISNIDNSPIIETINLDAFVNPNKKEIASSSRIAAKKDLNISAGDNANNNVIEAEAQFSLV